VLKKKKRDCLRAKVAPEENDHLHRFVKGSGCINKVSARNRKITKNQRFPRRVVKVEGVVEKESSEFAIERCEGEGREPRRGGKR